MMQTLSSGYEVVSLGRIVEIIKRGEKINPKAVAITFDDGYVDNYTFAAPILAKYGLTACFFIASGYIGTNRVFPWDEERSNFFPLMNWDQIRSLAEQGFEIGSHTIDHVDLGKEPLRSAKRQIVGSKEDIEDKIGLEVKYFSYPFGGKDNIREETRNLVKEAGFACCCSCYGGKVIQQSDLYDLPRIVTYPNCIEMRMELENFMTYLNGRMRINVPYLNRLA
jgi:peptidoglycan/xylan/chitin deacetylase (PgdA/CDA1 family)